MKVQLIEPRRRQGKELEWEAKKAQEPW